jgi:SAM-dependent methyltransferase
MSPPEQDMLAALQSFQPGDSTLAHYDAWAADYERDLLERCGYTAHLIGANAFAAANAARDLHVIDIGCGTGLVGAELRRLGFTQVDGLDISPGMLAHAATKRAYRQLLTGNVMTGTGLADGAFDAAICVGSFAPGHLGPAALAEIARLVRPRGPIVIVMNAVPYDAEGYAGTIDSLVAAGVWRVERIESINYMTAFDRPGKLIQARRT